MSNLLFLFITDISLCVFAEIIILNFCEMGYNTKKNIQRRADLATLDDQNIYTYSTNSSRSEKDSDDNNNFDNSNNSSKVYNM